MSRATRTAGESRRGTFANAISYALGVPITFGLLHAIDVGWIHDENLAHYTRFPVQKTAVLLFLCALCGLAGKLLRYLRERIACAKTPLPAWDGKPIPPAQVGALQQQLALQSSSAQPTYLGRRVRAVLDFVACRSSANDLDDQIRCLSDNDAIAMEGSYALLRFITWAIPIIGFLGTVLGITGAISNIDPRTLASDTGLTGVTQGLSEAFDTTALALFLTMILMFFCYLVERLEQGVLASVDRYVDEELTHRFARTRSEAAAGSSAATDQNAQVMLDATQQLVEKQVALWSAAVEKTEQLGSKQQERMATAIGQALEFALTRYGKRLAELEEGLLTRNQALIAAVGQLATALRDTGREHQVTLARLIDGLGAQVETLTKVQTGEVELLRVQELLGQNLALLAGANTFEQAVQSLSAAVHMLTARAAAPQTPALRIVPRSDAA